MAQIKDGWHKVYGEDVYVENGKVERGIKKDMNNSEVPCWPYEYDKKLGPHLRSIPVLHQKIPTHILRMQQQIKWQNHFHIF